MLTPTAVLISEGIGTALMIFLGVAVSISASLRGSSSVVGAAGWACAVFAGASVADASGAHLNPVVTLSQALTARVEWGLVPAYLAGEVAGALIGALLATAAFWTALQRSRDRGDLVTWFATSAPDTPRIQAAVVECLATAALIMWILNPPTPTIEDGTFNFGNTALGYAGIAFVIFVLSLGAGSTTGAALNPVRDLGPRVVYAVLFRSRGFAPAQWGYALVPVIGPLAGGLLAVPITFALELVPSGS